MIIEEIKKQIIQILEHNEQGIVRDKILSELQLRHQLSDCDLRAIVRIMIREGYPIGTSCTRGYFLIKCQKDLDDAVLELANKIRALKLRAIKLKENAERITKGTYQLNLFEIKGGGD